MEEREAPFLQLPEEAIDGEWHWLSFSSPGPLLLDGTPFPLSPSDQQLLSSSPSLKIHSLSSSSSKAQLRDCWFSSPSSPSSLLLEALSSSDPLLRRTPSHAHFTEDSSSLPSSSLPSLNSCLTHPSGPASMRPSALLFSSSLPSSSADDHGCHGESSLVSAGFGYSFPSTVVSSLSIYFEVRLSLPPFKSF